MNKKNPRVTNNSNQANGFTLIEVLIALVVLSLGILGVAGLQVKAQQFNRSAYLNTQATIIAHDMMERMRANPAALTASTPSYHLPNADKHDTCYTLAGCSAQEMAENDMYEWAGSTSDGVLSTLPGGSAVVCLDGTPDDGSPSDSACDGTGNIYVVKVWWQNKDSDLQRVVTTVAF